MARGGKANDDHGNKANITRKDLEAARQAGGVPTFTGVIRNIIDADGQFLLVKKPRK